MKEVSGRSFGLLIAYLVPGFLALCGLSDYAPAAARILAAGESQPSVGGFMLVTLASVSLGLVVSAIRWAVVDTIHHHTGVRRPEYNFNSLEKKLPAFEAIAEQHYRYYQFYANTLVAVVLLGIPHITGSAMVSSRRITIVFMFILVGGVLFAASRDTLRKYYARSSQLLTEASDKQKELPMTNGWGHHDGGGDNCKDNPRKIEPPPRKQATKGKKPGGQNRSRRKDGVAGK